MTRNALNIPLLLFTGVLAGACAAASPAVSAISGPPQWIAHIDTRKSSCDDIEAAFQNLGARYDQQGRITEDGLLAEHVFSRRLGRGEIAQSVVIESDISSGWLTATLIGGVSRRIGFAVSCLDGWRVVSETRSGQYLGEGVQQERFQQMSYFRQDRKGRLIARVLTNARYRTDFQKVSEESSENWFRFEPAPADND